MSGHPITFGDNVRVRIAPETVLAGVSGRSGAVYGETTPSVTGVEVIGTPASDRAINVHFDDLGEGFWLAEHLLEFIDHGAGTEITLDGVGQRWVRDVDGAWIEQSNDS